MTATPWDPSDGETILFESEEDQDDWIPPPIPDPANLPDNIDEWGPFYCWRGEAPSKWLLSIAITHEIHPPWHHGIGIVVRRGGGKASAAGIWWRGRSPRELRGEPKRLRLRKVVNRSRRLS